MYARRHVGGCAIYHDRHLTLPLPSLQHKMGQRSSKAGGVDPAGAGAAAAERGAAEPGRKSNWEVIEHYSKSGLHSGSVRSRPGEVGLLQSAAAPPAATAGRRRPCAPCLRLCRSHRFADAQVESLYQRYFLRMNQSSFSSLLGILMLVLLSLGLLEYVLSERRAAQALLPVLAVLLVLYAALALTLARARQLRTLLLLVFSCAVAVSFLALETAVVLTAPADSATAGVWLALFCVYMVYVLLPLRLREALVAGLLLSALHLALAGYLGRQQASFPQLVSTY